MSESQINRTFQKSKYELKVQSYETAKALLSRRFRMYIPRKEENFSGCKRNFFVQKYKYDARIDED